MVLFVHEDLADVFGHGEFTESFALANAISVIANGFRLVLEIELEHVPGFFGSSDWLWLSGGHATEIIDLVRNVQRVAKLFTGVFLQLSGDVHILGALQNLRIDHIRNDGLIFSS